MAKNKSNHKNKHTPNYSFLVSWSPDEARVNRELNSSTIKNNLKLSASKRAVILAKTNANQRIKKDIVKSLILVSFVFIIEIVVYLARSRFGIK